MYRPVTVAAGPAKLAITNRRSFTELDDLRADVGADRRRATSRRRLDVGRSRPATSVTLPLPCEPTTPTRT